MIRHEYKGFGGPPLPPQLPGNLNPSQSCSSSPALRVAPSGLPLVPAARPCNDASANHGSPAQHTQYPYVTGSSVVAFKYRDGVLMAADTLGSYGKTKRYKSVQRMHQVSPSTALGASGEISDYNYILTLLDELTTEDFTEDDGHMLGPREIHNYLTRVMYNRRNKFDPLWNTLVVAGFDPKEKTPFLGAVSMIGVQYEDDNLATGYGNHLARPILREADHVNMGEEEAIKLMEKCMEVLLARDSSCISKIQITKINASGVSISQPYAVSANWNLKFFRTPLSDPFSGSW